MPCASWGFGVLGFWGFKILMGNVLFENLKMFYLMGSGRVGGSGGLDGVSKVSFKFLYTL